MSSSTIICRVFALKDPNVVSRCARRCFASIALEDRMMGQPSSASNNRTSASAHTALFHSTMYDEAAAAAVQAAHAVPDTVQDPFDPRNYGYRVVVPPPSSVGGGGAYYHDQPTTSSRTTSVHIDEYDDPTSSMSWAYSYDSSVGTSRSATVETIISIDNTSASHHEADNGDNEDTTKSN